MAGRLAARSRSSSVISATSGRSSGSKGRACTSTGRGGRAYAGWPINFGSATWGSSCWFTRDLDRAASSGPTSRPHEDDSDGRVPRNGTDGLPLLGAVSARIWCSSAPRTASPRRMEDLHLDEEGLEELALHDEDEIGDRQRRQEPERGAPRRANDTGPRPRRLGHDEVRDDAAADENDHDEP